MSTTQQGASYYELLGVDEDATTEEIKKAYRKVARRLHPDVAGPGMEGLFNQVTRAHDVLSDPARRTEYDATRSGPPPVPEPEPEPAPWGTEEVIIEEPDPEPEPEPAPAPVPEPDPGPQFTSSSAMPHKGALNSSAALKLRLARVAAPVSIAVLVAFMLTGDYLWALLSPNPFSYYGASAATIIVSVPLIALRVFRRSGKVALGLMLALAGLQAMQGQWPGVAAVFLCIATAELWRWRWRHRANLKLATAWQQFQAAAQGRDRWVMSVAPHGNRTLALLQDPYTLDREQKMVWGGVVPGTWIVLGDAHDVVLACPEEARVAWESLYG